MKAFGTDDEYQVVDALKGVAAGRGLPMAGSRHRRPAVLALLESSPRLRSAEVIARVSRAVGAFERDEDRDALEHLGLKSDLFG